ncbi:MAG: DinB family protein [bacterium]|nr:DinB family protein [bacterium]
MSISASMLPEFDHEMATTRKTLERFVDAKADWKPHAKSFSMGELAGHLAMIPGWAVPTLESDSFDFAPNGVPIKMETPKTREEMLKTFDDNVAKARAALVKTSDAAFMEPWTLKANETVYFTQPKAGVMRGFVMNHMIHHRAQLGVYLRLNDLPHPSMYGPSADESM